MGRDHSARKKARYRQPPSTVETFDPTLATEVEELFHKLVAFVKPSGGEWRLPHPNDALRHPQHQHPPLQALKASLNATKNRLSDKDLSAWHVHTSSTHRGGKVVTAVRSSANAEICTQAWCKFYEILATFPLLPEAAVSSGELNTVHLCEAPGAFVSALNHYTKTSAGTRFCDWTWAANTLNPYHEGNASNATIADDRLIANTLPWWFFGSDDTGDLMSQRNLLQLQAFVGNMRCVDLVTADGSFDCLENPDEQEAAVASLHYCEAVAALLLLGTGGSLVLKMFTLYEHSSVCLLYLLNCCFRSVGVFKPATSKAGNSEVYVVCLDLGDKAALRPLLEKLMRNYGPDVAERQALFPASLIPASYLEQHQQVCAYFHRLQVDTITENLRLFGQMSAEQRHRLERVRDHAAREYLRRFQVTRLPRDRWLSRGAVSPAYSSVPAGGWGGGAAPPPGHKRPMGSFNERQVRRTLGWRQRVESGCHGAWLRAHLAEASGGACVLEGPLPDCRVDSWFTVAGGALSAVRNSAFCEGGLLGQLNEALALGAVPAWDRLPPCGACQGGCAAAALTEAARLCSAAAGAGSEARPRCLVVGRRSEWDAGGRGAAGLALTFSEEPELPGGPLHDGEPGYQRDVLRCALEALRGLAPGDALLLPLLSAATRVTAGLVYCLRASFRYVTFRCPPPSGRVGALLLCAGFCPEVAGPLLPPLTDLQERMAALAGAPGGPDPDQDPGGARQQVLQFVPMEELLGAGLTEFLSALNAAVVRQKMHLILQSGVL